MNVKGEFLVGQEHILLACKVHTHHIHNSCLAHSQMT